MQFTVKNPNYTLSPYTGMDRSHWLEVCEFLLDGVFTHVKTFDSPIVFPKYETEISYPRESDATLYHYQAEKFEGLARTLLVAAPLIKNKPDVQIGSYPLASYYKNQILRSLDPSTESYLGTLEELESTMGKRPLQHTCEAASLAYALWVTKPYIWDTYTKGEQDKIASYISDFGHSLTNHHNWRLFNMLILAFLKDVGYEIDEEVMLDHAMNILSYSVGDGWYRDGNMFDYYSPWAFQFYGPLWNCMYGYEHAPEIAKAIENSSNNLMKHYNHLFDRDSHVIMWGRSSIYRSAAAVPFPANFLLQNPTASPGVARKILSGSILQFITNPDTFVEGVPTLGFYRTFKPLVQGYSCAASPFWFANALTCLLLEEDHPIWTTVEENGSWESIGKNHTTVELKGPGIHITNFGATGTAELRTGKYMIKPNHPWMGEYSRLSFNSKFPWESIDYSGANSMQYSLIHGNSDQFVIPNMISYIGESKNVLYRRFYFNFGADLQHPGSIDTADIIIPNGVIRVDRVRIPQKPYTLLLGHYGLPHGSADCSVTTIPAGENQATIGSSEYGQLAFIPYKGWDSVSYVTQEGRSAVTDNSTLIYGSCSREKLYSGMYLLVTVMLHSTSDTPFTQEELTPITSIDFQEVMPSGSCHGATLHLRDKRVITVDFAHIEGKLTM